MNDEPVAFRKDGSPVYDNAATVCVGLVTVVDPTGFESAGLLAIRRNTEPGKGKIALPGGFHMRGETWQEAVAREVLEETGFVLDKEPVQIGKLVTDSYGHNLIFGAAVASKRVEISHPGEASQFLFLQTAGNPDDWAFPLHYEAAHRFLSILD